MPRKKVSLSTRRARAGDIDWNSVVAKAKEIVESYDTGVTLRQLYYRLVSLGLIPNKQQAYKKLSEKTAQARREGWFPPLIDRTREIERYGFWRSGYHAMKEAHEAFRMDRTQDQDWSIYLGVEKHGMSVQLMHWFGKMGLPVLALGGYSSQTFVDEVRAHVESYGRQSVLLYAGDFDASGVDIDRDFEERTEIFDEVYRVALNSTQVDEFDLPPMPGKEADSRSASFILKHGDLIQVELDALPPEDLRKLYQDAINRYWDKDAYDAVIAREAKEREAFDFFRDLMDRHAHNPARVAAYIAAEKLDDKEEILLVADAVADKLVDR